MAISGEGTLLRRFNTVTKLWENIAEVNSITGPDMSRETIDTTALDTAGGYRTFIPSFKDGGNVDLEMNFTRDEYETMLNDFESKDLQNYEIVFPDDDTTSLEFEAFVTNLSLTTPTDDKVTADVTIKISGPVTVESGSGPSAGV